MKTTDLNKLLDQLIEQQQLPAYYHSLVTEYLLPFSQQIADARRNQQQPLVLGVNGAQGSGKSTLCLFLKLLLENHHRQHCVVLSIDDFYLSHASRQQLAAEVHPLLATRGVPGTHDIPLATATLQGLLDGEAMPLPQFNKATDDVLPAADWPLQQTPVDVIVLEGWCVGALPQTDEQLIAPINSLEAEEDSDGQWRREINQRLATDYQQLFGFLDQLFMLKAPSMDIIYQWRTVQEQKLRAKTAAQDSNRLMNAEQIRRFIQHYERLSRSMLEEMPARADTVFTLDWDHRVASVTGLHGKSGFHRG
jgi:D-glycerate 3-kinase